MDPAAADVGGHLRLAKDLYDLLSVRGEKLRDRVRGGLRIGAPSATLKWPRTVWGRPMVEGETRIRVWLPRALREYSKGQETVALGGDTLADVIVQLNARFPGIGYRILNDQGRLRRYVLVFVNDDSVAHLEPEAVRLRDGDTVHILPSVAGG